MPIVNVKSPEIAQADKDAEYERWLQEQITPLEQEAGCGGWGCATVLALIIWIIIAMAVWRLL